MTEKPKNVHQRLASVMNDVTYIRKERKTGMNYTIVSHDAVTAKVRPALLAAGIVYYPVRCEHSHNGNRAECSMTVRFVNVDEPTDFFDVPTFGYGIDPQDKGPGKAMSYAVKYALLKALGMETGDDPDMDDIPHVTEAPKARPNQEVPPANQPKAQPTPAQVADKLIRRFGEMATLQELMDFTEPEQPAGQAWAKLAKDDAAEVARVKDSFDKRKAELEQAQ